MTVAATITVNPIGHAAPVSAGDEADWTHPTLGETWHGAVTGIRGRTAAVRWHSYTPRGGGRRKPMRHATRVPVHTLTPGRRRIAIKALAGGREPSAVKAQPDNTGGSMLAMYPPQRLAEALAAPDGLPAGEIHLTVAYTGDAADVDPAALHAVAGQLAHRSPVTAAIAGHARFTGADDHDVIVALADGSDLEGLRRDAMDRLSARGITVPRDHGYTPHLTLRYARPGDPDPVGRLKAAPVTFAGISAVHGGDRTDYPFTGDPAEVTRRPGAPGRPPKPEHAGGEMSTPATKALFAEDRHPRGHDGKWIEIGHDVTLPGGLHGQVTGMHGNRVLVDAADGTHRVVPAAQVTSNGPAAHGGFHPMHAPAPLSNQDYAAHRAMVESKINTELKAGRTTDRMHTIDGHGEVYTPERAAMHKQIVDDIMARHEHVPSEGKAIMAGGPGGAGKTTVLKGHAGVDTSKYIALNPDDVKEEMAKRGMVPHVPGLSPMEASTLIHDESSRVTNMLAKAAYAKKKNVIWDVSMSSPGSTQRRIDELHHAGYARPHGIYVNIPTETSVQRAIDRHRKGLEGYRAGQGHGGRYMPPSVIRETAGNGPMSNNRAAFNAVRHHFSKWDVYDNSVHGRAPQHIEGSHRP